jgi:capsule polysaccharide export protein KpsE/RkpR
MRSLAALALVAAAFAGSSCSSDGSSNTFCENRAELAGAISDLRDVNVVDDGVDALDSQLTVVLDDVDALKASAGDLQPEVDAVKTSVESLKTSVAAAASPVEKATALSTGLAAVQSAWQALTDASDADC